MARIFRRTLLAGIVLACSCVVGCGRGGSAGSAAKDADPESPAYLEQVTKKLEANPPPPGVKGTVNSGGEFVPEETAEDSTQPR